MGEVTQTHKFEFLVTTANTWQTFTFDTPYTIDYTSVYLGAGQPAYRILIHSAKSSTGTALDLNDILFRNESLTGFQAFAPTDLVLCKYGIILC